MSRKTKIFIQVDSQQLKAFFGTIVKNSVNRFNKFIVNGLANFIAIEHNFTLVRIYSLAMGSEYNVLSFAQALQKIDPFSHCSVSIRVLFYGPSIFCVLHYNMLNDLCKPY
jgi:hypothetical protein